MTNNIFRAIIEESAWCENHKTSRVDRDERDFSQFYPRCRRGNLLFYHPEMKHENEKKDCSIIIEQSEGVNKNDR